MQNANQRSKATSSFSAEAIQRLRQEKGLAIGEVAGRDSAAAIIKAASFDSIGAILPTLVYTGTEYGSWKLVFENVDVIKGEVETQHKKRFYEALLLGDPELWWALNGRFISVLQQRFGFYSPCFGCHLYMHLVRVPLAKELKCNKIISGERIKHDQKIKINQTAMVLDAYRDILDYAGIELIFPVREIASGSEINALVGGHWEEGDKQLKCVLRGNYRSLCDEVVYGKDEVRRYLNEFIMPVGRKVLDAWDGEKNLGEPNLNYIGIVQSVLADSR